MKLPQGGIFALILVVPAMLLVSNATAASPTITVSLSFEVVGGGTSYGPPVFTYLQNGVLQTVQLSTTPASVTIDSGSVWSISTQLPHTNSTVGWGTSMTSGKASLQMPTNFLYYYQASVKFGFTVIDGGKPSVLVTYTRFGTVNSNKPAGSSVWVDLGSNYSYASSVYSTSGTERWFAPGANNGTILSPVNLDVSYYHQFLVTADYSSVGQSLPSTPTLSGTALGAPVSFALSNSNTSAWLDSQTRYSVTPFEPLGLNERWAIGNPTSTVAGALDLNLVYYHQFSLIANYTVVGGPSPGQPTIAYFTAGVQVTQPISQSTAKLWADVGSSYSASLELPGSSPKERWTLASSVAGSMTSSTSISLVYYHQFSLKLSYYLVGNGSPAPPSFFYDSMGKVVNSTIGQQANWIDSETPVSVTQTLAGSMPGTRWQVGTQVPSIAAGPLDINFSYFLQASVRASFLVAGGGSPPDPDITYNYIGSPTKLVLPSMGWFDLGSRWSATSVINGTAGERWVTKGGQFSGQVTGPFEVSVTYQHQFLVQASPWSDGGGQVSTPTGWYDSGSEVSLQATPNQGWELYEWKGSPGVSGANATLNLTGPVTESAVFYPSVVIVAGPGGAVAVVAGQFQGVSSSKNPVSIFVPPGSTISLLATPSNKLLQFGKWSTPSNGNVNPLTFMVTGPARVSASFTVSVVNSALLATGLSAIAVGVFLGIRVIAKDGLKKLRKPLGK